MGLIKYLLVTLLTLAMGVPATWARTGHGANDIAAEMKARSVDHGQGFVVSGCTHATGSGVSFAVASCKAYLADGEYIEETNSRTITYTAAAGTYWLAVHKSIGGAVGTWTRIAGTHYLFKAGTARPATPAGALIVLKVIVDSAPDVAIVKRVSGFNPGRRDAISVADPAFGLSEDESVDASTAIQAALDASDGRCVYLPARIYVIGTTLTFFTGAATPADATGENNPAVCMVGAGMYRTIFDNQVASGPMLDINGSLSNSRFQYGLRLEDFSITSTTRPAASDGISIRGAYLGNIERVCIGNKLCAPLIGGATSMGLTGDALQLRADIGDADASSNIRIISSQFTDNEGWGINFVAASGVINMGYTEIRNNQINRNALGGVRWHSLEGSITHTSFVQNGNTTDGFGGLYVYYLGAGNRTLTVDGNQFDSNAGKANYDSHIRIDSIISARITNNEFRFNNVTPPGVWSPKNGILAGDGTNLANNLTIENNNIFDAVGSGDCDAWYKELTADQVGNRLVNNWFITNHCTDKYVFSGVNTTVLEGNVARRQLIASTINSSQDGGTTYAPDMNLGPYHRVSIGTGGTADVTILSPVNALETGRELVMEVFNGHGSTIAVTWPSTAGGYHNLPPITYVPNAKRMVCRFVRDVKSSGSWVPQGQCSLPRVTYFGSNSGPGVTEISAHSSTVGDATNPFTTTVLGAKDGCSVEGNPSTAGAAGIGAGFTWVHRVSATDTVETRVFNITTGALTPTDRIWYFHVTCNQ